MNTQTHSHPIPSPVEPIVTRVRSTVADYGLALLALLATGYASLGAAGGLLALKAAGVTGKAPEGADGFTKLIGALNDNLLWVFATCVGIAIVVGGVLMALGHSRAQDHLIRIGGGIAVVMVVAPSVVA